MSAELRGISSMATRQVLAELAAAFERQTGVLLRIESVGGVDAARRVQSGEPFDLVFLASDAIDKLAAGGALAPGGKTDLMRSPVAVAVRAGAAPPDISTEEALRRAVRAAPSIGYSTGPSGAALVRLFERWGIGDQVQSRLVQAPPGVPVGALVAQGEVVLGFQQYSELLGLDGIAIVGPLPEAARIITTFSGAVCAGSPRAEEAARVLAFMASPQAETAKRRHGMEAA